MAEQDFEELLRLFNKYRVRYCIVGAYAVAFHARPRYTKDIDFLVKPSIENGRKIVIALEDFGFNALKLTSKDFTKSKRFIQLGYEPVRIDLITSISGCSFEQIWKHRVRGRYGREQAWFIGLRELIRNKRLSGRPQDKADIEILTPYKNSKKTKRRR